MITTTAFSIFLAFLVCIYIGHVNGSEEDFDVICPTPDAFILHPDCRFYYQCTNSEPILKQCSTGLFFSMDILACDFPQFVPECIGGTRPPPDPTSPKPSTNEPSTIGPSQEPSTTELPSSTVPSQEPSTPAPITEQPTTTQNPGSTLAPFCPPTGVHDFPYPGNCSLFIRCVAGVEFILSCAPDLLFDKYDRVCKPAADAFCDEEENPTTTETPEPQPTTEAPEFDCPAEGYHTFAHNSDCSKYYLCFNGQLFIEMCANGTYYDTDPSENRCNLAELALCHSECPSSGISFLPIRTNTCRWYKVCFDGNSMNVACAENTIYHPVDERCVTLDSYTCPYTNEY